jgi:hypothetical protein
MISTRTLDKISQDTKKVKKDFVDLAKDSSARLNHDIERIAGEAQDTVSTAARTVAKDVSQGLTNYNTSVEDLVAKIPGNINKKASRYPWVAISMVLVIGLLVGVAIGSGSSS